MQQQADESPRAVHMRDWRHTHTLTRTVLLCFGLICEAVILGLAWKAWPHQLADLFRLGFHVVTTPLPLVTVGTFLFLSLSVIWYLLDRLAAHLARQEESLRGAHKSLELKARNLAHDYRNRLLGLRALRDSMSGQVRLDHLRRFSAILSDLNEYTEHLATRLSLEVMPVLSEVSSPPATYLRDVIDSVTKQSAALIEGRIRINVSLPDHAPEPFVAASRPALTRVLSNLLSNAVDACQDRSPRIAVNLSATKTHVVVQVSDNGVGIAPAAQAQLFGGNISTKGPDRGRGLTGARELARAWKGDLRLVSSIVGGGSTFEFTIPLAPTPKWFVNTIVLDGTTVLVVVDDASEVRDYWPRAISERYLAIGVPSSEQARVICLDAPSALRLNAGGALEAGTLFLIDQHFDNDSSTGLEVVIELGLERKAVIVTSHFEQEDIQTEVERLGLKMLPKTFMLNAKLQIEIGARDA